MDIPHFVYLYSPVGAHSGFFQFLFIRNNATFAYRPLCEYMLLFLLDRLLGVSFLSHMVNLCLTFKETATLFSKVIVSLYIPTGNV